MFSRLRLGIKVHELSIRVKSENLTKMGYKLVIICVKLDVLGKLDQLRIRVKSHSLAFFIVSELFTFRG